MLLLLLLLFLEKRYHDPGCPEARYKADYIPAPPAFTWGAGLLAFGLSLSIIISKLWAWPVSAETVSTNTYYPVIR